MTETELMNMWGEYLDTCREVEREARGERFSPIRFTPARGAAVEGRMRPIGREGAIRSNRFAAVGRLS